MENASSSSSHVGEFRLEFFSSLSFFYFANNSKRFHFEENKFALTSEFILYLDESRCCVNLVSRTTEVARFRKVSYADVYCSIIVYCAIILFNVSIT